MSAETDPVKAIDTGDATTVTTRYDSSVWAVAPSEVLGDDRRVEDVTVTDASIVGEPGYEHVDIELEFDVKRVDPDVKPVFQTKTRYANRSDTDVEVPVWEKVSPIVGPMLAVGVSLATSLLAASVTSQTIDKLTVNGESVGMPDPVMLFGVVFVVTIVLLGSQYIPNRFNGVGQK